MVKGEREMELTPIKLGGETCKTYWAKLEGYDVSSGIAKLYSDPSSAAKEIEILSELGKLAVEGSARIIEVMEGANLGFEKGSLLVLESRLGGPKASWRKDPQTLEKVQQNAALMFNHLGVVSSNENLVNQGNGYCGDISAGNVIETSRGYAIVDWSGKFGRGGKAELTRGYIAPEVLNENSALYEVNADTYSLGAFLFRMLVGKEKFDGLISDCTSGCLNPDEAAPMVPSEVRYFFRLVLSEDPLDRLLVKVQDAKTHYRTLAKLFGSNPGNNGRR